MKSEIETLGPCKIKIKVEIPTDEIRDKVEEKYNEVRQSVVLPGFRKGHVPRPILEKRYKKTVEQDAKVDLIEKSIARTLEEKKIQAVGDPDIDPEKIEFALDKPLNFELTVETKPEIKPKDYLGLSATRKAGVVTDDEIVKALDRLAASRAEWVPATTCAKDDMVIADLSLKEGDKDLMTESNMRVVVSEDLEVLHQPAPQVFKALLGAASGDTRTAEIAIPADHKDESLRGKTVAFHAVVKEVKHLDKPAIDEAWAKAMDYENLDQIKADLKRRLQVEKDAASSRAVEDQIMEALLKSHEIPLPEALLRKFAERAEERAKLELQMKGVSAEEAVKMVEKERDGSRGELEKSLREHFLLEAIGQKERIFVTEDEVDTRIEAMASAYRRNPGEVRGEMEERGQMSELRSTLRDEKIRRFLREKAKITEAN
ncbi:MAG: trigger factor [Planctomycetes bacterium]|nr:trigger factor [Planctomycetota bacterium]